MPHRVFLCEWPTFSALSMHASSIFSSMHPLLKNFMHVNVITVRRHVSVQSMHAYKTYGALWSTLIYVPISISIVSQEVMCTPCLIDLFCCCHKEKKAQRQISNVIGNQISSFHCLLMYVYSPNVIIIYIMYTQYLQEPTTSYTNNVYTERI